MGELVCVWHLSDLLIPTANVGYEGESGSRSDIAKLSRLTRADIRSLWTFVPKGPTLSRTSGQSAVKRREFIILAGGTMATWSVGRACAATRRARLPGGVPLVSGRGATTLSH